MDRADARLTGPTTTVLMIISCGLCLLAPLAAWTIDEPLARFLYTRGFPGDIAKFIALCEVFSHGAGVGGLLIVILCLDPQPRRVLRLAICAFGGGLTANAFKLVVARMRPHTYFQVQLEQSELASSFGPFLPWANGDKLILDYAEYGSAFQSFPSGHTATAAGFAVALVYFYPRGRWIFFVLVLMAAVQRWETNAHFLSDTMVGAAIGFVWAGWFTKAGSRGANWLLRYEQAAARGADPTPTRADQAEPDTQD
ncbi:MAG: phosphatase PAP2 family protein [Pirellulaceae bacterium]|jgi:membrane-associated phospholipid phosphatase|nr:phosphatase PAP2 family protein [Pirellulaceae bacterium]